MGDMDDEMLSSFENCSGYSTREEIRGLALNVLKNLRSHETDVNMQLNGLEALCQITCDVLSKENNKEDEEYFGETYWLQDINIAMELFPHCGNLQETACRCLFVLLQQRPMLCGFIGDDDGKIPLVSDVLAAMDKHFHSPFAFQSVCKAISVMSSNCDILQQELIEKDLQKPILDKISTSKEHGEQVLALEVLICLSRRNMHFKMVLLKEDILSVIANVFEEFPNQCRIQEQAIILLATLANDFELVRQQCIVDELHYILLEVLDMFDMDQLLIEVTFEALGVLCAAEGVPDILRKSNGLHLTLDVMKKHMTNFQIQKKGLVLLQLLVTNYKLSPNTFSLLINVIKNAMDKYQKDIDIQTESCVILYLLAEDNYQASVDLIKLHVHEQFFKILENFPRYDSALDVASSCIYELAVVHNLKNQMLLGMCALGYVRAVECLIQLGADVNYEEDGNTPLCLACRANNLELVNFLLKQGVADVHNSLALCLELDRHYVTGFILKHIGHDEDGGTITLTGLKLRALHTEWLAPALMGNAAYSSHIASYQWWDMVRKAHELKMVRRRLSSSICSTQEDDEDIFCEEDIPRISPWSETMTEKKDSSSTGKLRSSSPPLHSSAQARQIPIPTPPDYTEYSENGSSVDSNDRFQVMSLSSARLQSVSGVSIPYSSGDPRLVTVQEASGDVILPASFNPNEAFCLEEMDVLQRTRRRYSDSFHTTPPMLLRRLANLEKDPGSGVAGDVIPKSASPMAPKKKSMCRSKSGSMIDSGMPSAAAPQTPNPVHRLDLSFNEIQSMTILARKPCAILHHLSLIENLDLSYNKLDGIPDDLHRTMPRLRHLVLHHNHLRTIPKCVFSYSSLERLDLSHNNIAQVEKPAHFISNFVSRIDLSNNMIKEFPVWFGDHFPLLTSLDLSFNWLAGLPSDSVKLSKLQFLNLSSNSIPAIRSTFMSQMKDLETLKASHNGLKSLPESAAPFLVKLGIVKLSHNHLTEKAPFYITKFILLLPNVHTVDLSENGLQSIASPTSWSTNRLKDLNVSCNEIKRFDLTGGADKWAFLARLDLSFNYLKQIPNGIGELKSLGQLNISGNTRITVLPDEMGNLGKLWELLHSDVKLDLNGSILRGRTRDLVGHLHARLKNSAPFPQRKVVVCGPRGSGKSTLLRLLPINKVWKKVRVQERRKLKGKYVVESLEVQKWLINDVKADCRCCCRKNVTLILRMWKFPGSKASVWVHRCFLSENALHMLVYDVSLGPEEVENLKPWLANIHDQCPGAGVILVGTHLDMIPVARQQSILNDVVERVKKIHSTCGLPEISGHFVVSCVQKKNTGLDNLARRLVNLAMACNTKGQLIHNHRVPKSFIRLQEIVESKTCSPKLKSCVVDLSFLRKIVMDSKLDINQEELNEAVVFLRQSGLLVNYAKPAARLNELLFLIPPKLASLIAKVITFFDPFSHLELIEHDDICSIIVKEGFSKLFVPQILRLLEDFEIALPVTALQYLVASDFPDKRLPSLIPVENKLRRRYTLPYVPVGLWRRLLVHLLLYSNHMLGDQRQLVSEQPLNASCQYSQREFSAYWSKECHFIVEISDKMLDIVVPCNRDGQTLLGNLAYHIDTLLREWFSDLCGVDSIFGHPSVRKTTFCISCQEHEFPMEDCVSMAQHADAIECPVEHAIKPLDQLVPDVLLSHLDQRFFIENSDLEYEETAEALLGEGGFGSVYRAKYRERNVAIKVFRTQMEMNPREHLEQEVRFLTKLRHPSIIDLIGICSRPCAIAVLELAPLGSLNTIFRRQQKLSRGVQHKIAMQVAEGVAFLHRHTIVYRDLKPHNILIFSIAAGTLINAKISDFGTSRYATPCGFIASEGTPGYRAPEVARGDVVYNEKADIFSLGMLLYELATGGKQPFSNLKFRNELDEAVIVGRPVDPIVVTNTPPWPDMQDLLDHMLEAQPENRPTAEQVYQRLSDAEFISLKQDIAVCKGQAVECMTVRCFTEDYVKKMEVWIGSGASDWTDEKKKGNTKEDNDHARTSQLSRVDLSTSKSKGCKGMILRDGRIMAITSIGENLILVGTQTGNLWVYNARTESSYAMSPLPDAVICIRYTSFDHQDCVFAGLANGELAMYYTFEFENPPKSSRIINVGESVCCHDKPMMCLTVAKKRLLCGVGHSIVVFKLGQSDMNPEYNWSVAGNAESHKGLVSNIVVDKQGVWTSTKGSSRIHLWDFKTHQVLGHLNCEDIKGVDSFEESSRGMRVVSLLIHNNVLWVGTGSGRILLIDARSMSPLMAMNRHKSAVRCLTTAVLDKDCKPISVVLSGGLGFIPRQSSPRASSSRDFGYVLVWESGIHKESEHLHEYKQKRQEWLLNHINK